MRAEYIRKYSPHLAGELERIFGPNDLETLENAFRNAIDQGGLEEPNFKRAPGVSYNPRPARIALILLNDVGVRDVTVLSEAIIGVLDKPLVAAATWLDDARHLHLSKPPLSPEDKQTFLDETDRFIALSENYSKELALRLKTWRRRNP